MRLLREAVTVTLARETPEATLMTKQIYDLIGADQCPRTHTYTLKHATLIEYRMLVIVNTVYSISI